MEKKTYRNVLHAAHVVGDEDLGGVEGLALDGCQLLHCHLPTGLCLAHNLHAPHQDQAVAVCIATGSALAVGQGIHWPPTGSQSACTKVKLLLH